MVNGIFNTSQLANQINARIREYSNGVGINIEESAKKIARKGSRKLKVRREGQFEDRTGDYRKGWRARKERGIWIVHNATDYQLTHLLEKGTEVRGVPHSRPFPHIAEVEQEMIEEFTREVERAIRG